VHFNPCGRAVDWIQFPFEVDARVHRGADAPIVRLRWMYTSQPFLPVGTGSVINNRIWNKDHVSMLEVGQLPPKESDFDQDERWALPAALVPGHMCHPEWFATGEPWPIPSDLPPTEYTPDGIPVCCGLFVDPTEGGIEIGGENEPAPGWTCATAVELALGVVHALEAPPVGFFHWYKFTIPFFHDTRVYCQFAGPPYELGWAIMSGCPPSETVYVDTGFPNTFILPVNGILMLRVASNVGGEAFDFRADALPI